MSSIKFAESLVSAGAERKLANAIASGLEDLAVTKGADLQNSINSLQLAIHDSRDEIKAELRMLEARMASKNDLDLACEKLKTELLRYTFAMFLTQTSILLTIGALVHWLS